MKTEILRLVSSVTLFEGGTRSFSQINRNWIVTSKSIRKTTTVYVDGGYMTSELDMSNNKIVNVAEPIDSSDVTTKGYVDANKILTPGQKPIIALWAEEKMAII